MRCRKHKTKLWPLLGALLVLMLVLTACGSTDKDSTKDETSKADTKVEEEKKEEKEKAPEGAITIASFNIATGRDVSFDLPVIAQDIADSGAAIVALQEVDQNTTRNGKQDTMQILSSGSGLEHYAYAPALTPFQEGEYGIGLLSKYPIESMEYHQLPMLVPAEEEQRVVLHAKVNVDGFILDFFVTHGQQVSIRRQLTAINEYTSQCENFILAGDFNTSSYNNYKLIENSYSVIGDTNPMMTTADLTHSFDNIVLSNSIKSYETRTVDTKHSDHLMLLTEVVLPTAE